MLFNSISYFIFLPVVFALYWSSPRWLKKPVLLVASYFFYMSWIPKYGLMVAILSLINYGFGLALEKCRSIELTKAAQYEGKQASPILTRFTLIAGLAVNLGCLCYFKYVNFFLTSAVDAANFFSGALQIHADKFHALTFNIILPLGISFFVFEFIHYLVDVYKGEKAVRNPIDFALFAAFFPSQIAGPIKRFEDFIQQINGPPGSIETPLKFRATDMQAGMALLLQGLFKKVALADNLAIIVNAGFNPALHLTTIDAWTAALGFVVQVYFDFSGYTDMGRGSALLLGISLPDNFNFPYLANSISDFWRRWHISLSSWLRDYLYIPLGGGRKHKGRNLFITMVLAGLWHGAALHFVVFGAYQGFLLVANDWYGGLVKKSEKLTAFHSHISGKVLSVIFTFALVTFGFIVFRADTVTHALSLMQTMLLGANQSEVTYASPILLTMLIRSPVMVPLLIYSCYAWFFSLPKFASDHKPVLQPLTPAGWALRLPVYAAVAASVLGFAPLQPSSFIYFQF